MTRLGTTKKPAGTIAASTAPTAPTANSVLSTAANFNSGSLLNTDPNSTYVPTSTATLQSISELGAQPAATVAGSGLADFQSSPWYQQFQKSLDNYDMQARETKAALAQQYAQTNRAAGATAAARGGAFGAMGAGLSQQAGIANANQMRQVDAQTAGAKAGVTQAAGGALANMAQTNAGFQQSAQNAQYSALQGLLREQTGLQGQSALNNLQDIASLNRIKLEIASRPKTPGQLPSETEERLNALRQGEAPTKEEIDRAKRVGLMEVNANTTAPQGAIGRIVSQLTASNKDGKANGVLWQEISSYYNDYLTAAGQPPTAEAILVYLEGKGYKRK